MPSAAQTGNLTLTRDGTTDQPLTLAIAVAGTATPGLDYVALPTSVTVPAGSSSASIAVTPIDNGALNAVRQAIVVPAAAGGTYTLSVGDDTTAPLAYNADAATVQAALQSLADVGTGNVLVVGAGAADDPFVVAFKGLLAYASLPAITGDGTDLVGAATIGVSATPPDSAGIPTQIISISGATGGTFTLSTGADTTSSLAWNASADAVAAALEALGDIGGQVVSVTGNDGGPWAVAFQAGSAVAPLLADNSQLTGGTIGVSSIEISGSPIVEVSLLPEANYNVVDPYNGGRDDRRKLSSAGRRRRDHQHRRRAFRCARRVYRHPHRPGNRSARRQLHRFHERDQLPAAFRPGGHSRRAGRSDDRRRAD